VEYIKRFELLTEKINWMFFREKLTYVGTVSGNGKASVIKKPYT
jgi:hypothetical protein